MHCNDLAADKMLIFIFHIGKRPMKSIFSDTSSVLSLHYILFFTRHSLHSVYTTVHKVFAASGRTLSSKSKRELCAGAFGGSPPLQNGWPVPPCCCCRPKKSLISPESRFCYNRSVGALFANTNELHEIKSGFQHLWKIPPFKLAKFDLRFLPCCALWDIA